MEIVIFIIVVLFFTDTIKEMKEKREYDSYEDMSDLIVIEHTRVPLEEYDTYRRYLKSDQWKSLRFDTFFRDEFTCTRCASQNKLECHHIHYGGIETMTFHIGQLETVCSLCHTKIHKGELPMKKHHI